MRSINQRLGLSVTAAMIAVMSAAGVRAQPVAGTDVTVQETAGIRRTEYPVSVRVPFPRGTVTDLTHVRLRGNGAEVAAQFTADRQWDDGSARWVWLDFNTSIGAGESRTFRLEYGNGVTSDIAAKGLTVTEAGETIQVGSVKFNKTGWPLLASVAYRGEIIGEGRNGLTLVDATGGMHDFGTVRGVTVAVLKRGPLSVLLRYTGTIPIDPDTAAAVVLTCEMPNSKSWVKCSAAIEDPGRKIRGVVFETPFALGAQPWTWDFGTDSGTYGVLRTTGDSAVLTQHVSAKAASWQAETATPTERRVYETSVAGRATKASGWGHLLDARNAIAFAIDRFARDPGTYTFSLNGAGQASIGYAPALPAVSHHLTVYQHYVGTPVAIGAATSPAAMLGSLVVSIAPDQYERSGERPPAQPARPPAAGGAAPMPRAR